MSTSLSEDVIFSTARALLIEDAMLTLQVSNDVICVKIPTTRRIAERLEVPHYYVLPYFASLESRGCLTRTERVGIFTTMEGTKELFANMSKAEQTALETICGPALFAMIKTE